MLDSARGHQPVLGACQVYLSEGNKLTRHCPNPILGMENHAAKWIPCRGSHYEPLLLVQQPKAR